MNKFKITTEYITLGQFLKATDHIGSGGQAKFFLFSNDVMVNREKRTERGKKLYPGDVITVDEMEYMIIHDSKDLT
ncbi:MAG: S4 domain-containing protein YaaA [Acholeplasmataceae bacterium]|jgi:S4 domain protein YaaA|nr:S4 domain-containing protein YaaA [Acholeplasmataceae bacterium]